MNTLSLNIRGVGEEHKKSWIKRLCIEQKVKFAGFQETMVRDVNRTHVQSMWNHTQFDFVHKMSQGKSGGILAVWNTSCFIKIDSLEGDGFLAIIDTIYSLLYLAILMKLDTSPKRRVTVFDPRGASKFNDFIASSSLCDLPIGGKRFTRMNSLGTKLSKIDRVLVSHHFLIKWPNSHVLALLREYSDHSPLLLSITTPNYGPTPFKLYNSWIDHTKFHSLVHDSWVTIIIERPLPLAVVLKVKLQNLKRKIKQWRLTITRLDSAASSELRQKIDILDTKAETTPLSSSDVITRTESVKLLADIDHRKLKDLKQKAKVKWAVEGDENSNFFHG
ncbi:cytochrome P450, partial [Tanacetum coccineum]